MMRKFKVGDKVLLPKNSKELRENYRFNLGWNIHMDSMCGKVGVIEYVGHDFVNVYVDEKKYSWFQRDLRSVKRLVRR